MPQQPNAKTNIIKAAAHLFQEQGYHGTGLNQIIAESGSPKGSLYHYFPKGKEELAVAAIERTSHEVRERLRAGLDAEKDPGTMLSDFVTAIADAYDHGHKENGLPVAAIALEMATQHESIRQACEQAYESWFQVLKEKLVESGVRHQDPAMLAEMCNALIEGAFISVRIKGHTEPLRQVASMIPLLVHKQNG
ncbi:TetR/AcrR family transcriptional regulator [Salisediminibacterium selenitireducens]|uniref:Transcriptional regulator, TetR family n=1 Tax=Bacillus selenitireducens (strain ATCC 700615 / DSM 15326 / MLS10) TaxID=439292 RepID=D6XYA3_BACIE|nr:TetR/AcrR family transcriptional regulator [Salisediminibacterium selenitireducens]ADI00172.1 transcriptional regulator, TetR family [[Bacillus] selenitireducens MLS10]